MLGAAVIGCGDAGSAHALTVSQSTRTTLTAVLDVQDERAAQLAARYGGSVVRSVPDVVAAAVAAVAVATGPIDQPDVVTELAAAGYRGALLCEKPLAVSLGEARRLVDVARDAGMVLAVNHVRRFGAPVVAAHQLLAEGTVGRLLRVEGCSPDGTLLDAVVADLARVRQGRPPLWEAAEGHYARVRAGRELT